MCKFKSGLLLKDRTIVADHDNHSQMLEENGISDSSPNPGFIRFELEPARGDPFSPIAEWRYRVDQDWLPDWYVEEIDKPRAIEAVSEWAKAHIYIGVNGMKITEGSAYYLKDCTNVVLSGSSTVQNMWGSSTVQNMWDSSTVRNMRDSSTVQDMRDSSTVRNMRDSSTVQDMWGSSTVQNMWDSSTVRNMRGSSTVQDMRDSSTVRVSDYHDTISPDTIILSDNATLQDAKTHTIYHSGAWTLSVVPAKTEEKKQ